MYTGNKISYAWVSYTIGKYITAICMAWILIFTCIEILPGTSATIMAGTTGDVNAYVTALGLDVPWYQRFFAMIVDILSGGGVSFVYKVPVFDIIWQRLGVSLPIAIFGFVVSTVLGVSMGICAVAYRSVIISICIAILLAIPVVWLSISAIYFGAVVLGWFPFGGTDSMQAYILPIGVIGISQGMITAHYTRVALSAIIHTEYIHFARLRGLGKISVLLKHGVPAVSGALWALFGLQMGFLITGVVVVEKVFSIAGMGDLLFQAVLMRDTPLIAMLVSLMCVCVIVINAIADMGAYMTNPILRQGYKKRI